MVSSIYSQQKGASLLAASNIQKSNDIYAVVVGISDYQDPCIPDLRYADKDALSFANYLRTNNGRSNGSGLDKDHLKVLINQEATMAKFAGALDWLWEVCKEGDQAIIYFSGHGDVEQKSLSQPGFLLCWDAPCRVYMGGGAFSLHMLQEAISTLSIQNKAKVIVITDACHSGALAGSSVGGAQATASNLAKQFGNEVKILSCQPNEFSIEGEQWGGGRGVFSYHLIDALYGLADNNDDHIVNLQEVGRYLEDHVSKEVAPFNQVPLIIGNRNEKIAVVNSQLLSSIRSGETNKSKILDTKESEDKEVEILKGIDEKISIIYDLFKGAIKNKLLLTSDKNCANYYYEQLIKEPKLALLFPKMKQDFAAAMQDEAQQAINDYLMGDPKELKKRWAYDDRYQKFPLYLNKAAELLGEAHYLYQTIKAREHYFNGLNMRLRGERNKDTFLFRQAMTELNKTLMLDSTASYGYNEMGLLERRFKNYQSAIHYFNQAILYSPKWVFPMANLTLSYGDLGNMTMAIQSGIKAISTDPNSPFAQYNLARVYEKDSNWIEAIKYYSNTRKLDSSIIYSGALLNIGFVLYLQKKYSEAEQVVIKYSILYPENTSLYIPAFLVIYFKQGMEDKSLIVLEEALKNGYKDFKSIEEEPDLKDFITNPKYLALKKKYFN